MQIKLENISKSFVDADRELTVIGDLSFAFPEKGSVGIVGKSGVGKSTLLYLLAGIESPSSGKIWFGKSDLTGFSQDQASNYRAANMGFVFQSHNLLAEFNAIENVAMPLVIQGQEEAKAQAQAEQVLKRVGLANRLSHRPSQLSGGEQQRVAVARAIVGKPGVILADEPTGNLDPGTANEIEELFRETTAEIDALVVVVTHNTDLAGRLDYVYEMQAGGELLQRGGS